MSVWPILLDQISNANSELKPLVREEEVISHLCCASVRGEGLMSVCKQRKRWGKVSLSPKSVQNKPNAFLWAYFEPNLVACLAAFVTTTPIVRAERWASCHYIQLFGVNGKVNTAQKEQRRRDQKDNMGTSGHKCSLKNVNTIQVPCNIGIWNIAQKLIWTKSL